MVPPDTGPSPAPADDEVPAFLWDRHVTAADLRRILDDPTDPRRHRLLATLLREARPDEVWRWVHPRDVARELPILAPLLGRQRDFWEWLIDGWRRLGLLP